MKLNGKSAQRRHQAQSGQAIVLIALMMVALLGTLGLAIDGGGLYFKHRDTQNAVDAAVLAALYTKCTTYPYRDDARVIAEGEAAAASNGYANVANNVSMTIDPAYLPPGEAAWPSGFVPYVRAAIDARQPSHFIQLVYPAPLWVTSSAIGECNPSMASVIPGQVAIMSLKPVGCGGTDWPFKVTGGAGVNVRGGDIYSNSDCADKSLWVSGTTNFHVDGACQVNGGTTQDSAASVMDCGSLVDPGPLWSDQPFQDIAVPDEACNSTYAQPDPKGMGTVTINPGYYESITVQNGDHVTFSPGFYCVKEFTSTGGGPGAGTVHGDGVVIYMPPAHGVWHATALSTFELQAPRQDHCGDDPSNPLTYTCPWKDLLLWADATQAQFDDPSMAQEVRLNGNETAIWTGTIYAPRSQCTFQGGGTGFAIRSQVICWSVDLEGQSQLDIIYDPPDFLRTAPRVTLNE